jgi:DNA replication and repair protein RecF
VFITNLSIKNFRCFKKQAFDFQKRLIIIEGTNGSGKTTLLEALYYACYLRSFRTHITNQLVNFDKKDYFFIDVGFQSDSGLSDHHIQIGVSNAEKVVKFDQKSVKTYKELVSHYRVVSVTEDDINLVQGAPELRRTFLNQSIVLADPDYLQLLRSYKQILQQRNSLLVKLVHAPNPIDNKELEVWSKQLWNITRIIQQKRKAYAAQLETLINKLHATYFPFQKEVSINLEYHTKNISAHRSFSSFWKEYRTKHVGREVQWGRSLFGAHLDDLLFVFHKKLARVYASRGQQKLTVFLLKVAQIEQLHEQQNESVLLLDDFLTDLDQQRFTASLSLLQNLCQKNVQVFISCPLTSFITGADVVGNNYEIIRL